MTPKPKPSYLCAAQVKVNPSGSKEGSAPIYGLAASMPVRGVVGELLTAYMDASC